MTEISDANLKQNRCKFCYVAKNVHMHSILCNLNPYDLNFHQFEKKYRGQFPNKLLRKNLYNSNF